MKKNLLILLCILSPFFGPSFAEAAIDVTFETTPLFGISNFLPGDTITKTVTVTNNGTVTEDVYSELVNVIDGGLAPMMDVEITSGGTLFAGSFDDFENANEQFLTTLPAGSTVVYDYKMSFKSQAGNEYQEKSLGFDICVGFSGGQFECDITDTPTDNPGDGGGGGGGNGGGSNSDSLRRSGQVLGDVAPTPQVLGDQTSIIPIGAPNTGFGFISRTQTLFIWFFLGCIALVVLRQYVRLGKHVG